MAPKKNACLTLMEFGEISDRLVYEFRTTFLHKKSEVILGIEALKQFKFVRNHLLRETMNESEVHVWYVSLDQNAVKFQELEKFLSSGELSRAENFFIKQDKIRYVVRRGFLRILLGYYLNTNPKNLSIQYNQYGKPSIENPTHGKELSFNISHSQGLALFAFTLGRNVGVDIEKFQPIRNIEKIAAHHFSYMENTTLNNLEKSEKLLGFFNCWTRKEAYLKAKGCGLFGSMAGFSVSLTPGSPVRILNVCKNQKEVLKWSLIDVSPTLGFVAALCIGTSLENDDHKHKDTTVLIRGLC